MPPKCITAKIKLICGQLLLTFVTNMRNEQWAKYSIISRFYYEMQVVHDSKPTHSTRIDLVIRWGPIDTQGRQRKIFAFEIGLSSIDRKRFILPEHWHHTRFREQRSNSCEHYCNQNKFSSSQKIHRKLKWAKSCFSKQGHGFSMSFIKQLWYQLQLQYKARNTMAKLSYKSLQ